MDILLATVATNLQTQSQIVVKRLTRNEYVENGEKIDKGNMAICKVVGKEVMEVQN